MKIGWQRGWGGNRKSLPSLVFILSMATTICAWVWAGLIVGSKDQERFDYAREEAQLAIKGRVDDQVDLLRATAATFSLNRGWTLEQFHQYVTNLGLSTNFSGSQGLGFIKRVFRAEVPSLEKTIRAEGEYRFAVHPPSNESEQFPIVYLEPRTRANSYSIGYDSYSETVRREAMMAAQDSGVPTISGIVAPNSSSGRNAGQGDFLLYCPIYQGGEVPAEQEERRKLLVGFVFSRFRGNDIFQHVLEGGARHDLDVEIFDVPPGKHPVLFYTSSKGAVHRVVKLFKDVSIPIQGRQWIIRYLSSFDFEQQSAAWLVSWIPIAGFVVSLLLGVVSFSQVRANRQLMTQTESLVRREAEVRMLNENLEHIVTERTTELQATNYELEAFCYSVSHDLRAPLRSVDGFSKSLLEDYRDQLDDQAKEYIQRVRNASHRMDELISALLNLSRITRLEIVRQPIDLSHMAQATLEDALEDRDRDKVKTIVQPGLATDGDPKLIRVLLDNLVRNAVKFSANSSTAIIEVGIKDGAFFVRDNGVGFNPAYTDKLFVAFERLHSPHEYPGSGIGLATVQRIVQRHGGKVWAEGEEGKGATFYFTLR